MVRQEHQNGESKRKKNTKTLPPDENSLNHHLDRTNYLSFCQLNFKMKDHPSPLGHGWQLQNGLCRPVRHSCPALPDISFDDIQTESTDENLSSEDDCSECGMSSESEDED